MLDALVNHVQLPPKDDYRTPAIAVYPLLKYLPDKFSVIWECCDSGDSAITTVLRENGYSVISTSIDTGFDFLRKRPTFSFDLIVTNPPYSLKDSFLRKCYEYDKPFALLLPIYALGGIERVKLFREKGISAIVFDKRLNFKGGSSKVWFNSAWFCYKLLPHNTVVFERL